MNYFTPDDEAKLQTVINKVLNGKPPIFIVEHRHINNASPDASGFGFSRFDTLGEAMTKAEEEANLFECKRNASMEDDQRVFFAIKETPWKRNQRQCPTCGHGRRYGTEVRRYGPPPRLREQYAEIYIVEIRVS